MNKNILEWEVAGILFILFIGSGLHFAFEMSNYSYPIAAFAAVNESIWEHLKMVFWPGLFFFIVQYRLLWDKEDAARFWTAKALCLFLMPLVIAGGWYGIVALTGQHYFIIDIALFVGAVIAGQLVSYRVLTGKIPAISKPQPAMMAILLLALAFVAFSYFPPKIFLFEHGDLDNTGQYGILDSYDHSATLGE